jgi:3'-5' exoribonuclease Rv2179c-like domain
MDIMVSVKSLGNKSNSAIYQIGAVAFDLTKMVPYINGFSRYISIDAGALDGDILAKLLSSPGTKYLAKSLSTRAVDEHDALVDFSKWVSNWDNIKIWTWEPFADLTKLRFAYEKRNLEAPWRLTQEKFARKECMHIYLPKIVHEVHIAKAVETSKARIDALHRANNTCPNLLEGILNISTLHLRKIKIY